MKAARPRISIPADRIEAQLAKRFKAPEFAFMPQLNQGTGVNAGRRADAVAFSLWPSRGLHLHGFEIKVSRNDLAQELRQPAKAEAIQQFCHFWWLAVPRELVSDADLIPPTWGILEVDGNGVRVRKQAPLLTPQDLTITITAAIFRSFSETVPYLRENYVHVEEIEKTVQERIGQRTEHEDRWAKSELKRLEDKLATFEEQSGIRIDSWDAGRIGEVAKKLVEAEGVHRLRSTLQHEAERLTAALGAIEAARRELASLKEGAA